MKRILNWVLAATLICGASVFTSCEKSDTVLSDKILGKWIVADLHSEPPLVVSQLLERQDCLPVR